MSAYSASCVGATTSIGSTLSSERLLDALQLPRAVGHHVEANGAAAVLAMRRQPGARRTADATHLLRRHHLERIAEARAGLRLHFAEDEVAPAADDQVDLVAAGPDVLAEDAVAAQPVMPARALLSFRARTPRVPGGPPAVRGRRG